MVDSESDGMAVGEWEDDGADYEDYKMDTLSNFDGSDADVDAPSHDAPKPKAKSQPKVRGCVRPCPLLTCVQAKRGDFRQQVDALREQKPTSGAVPIASLATKRKEISVTTTVDNESGPK